MKTRLLVLAAVSVFASQARAQTLFNASGGDVIITPTGSTNVPYDFFLDALGHATRLVAAENGTQFTLDTKGQVATSSLGALGSLNLGFFATGTPLIFSLVSSGVTDDITAFYLRKSASSYFIQIVGGSGKLFATDPAISFNISGIASLTNPGCSLAQVGPPAINCSDIAPGGPPPVTSTPEPGTIALVVTGLAGLVPIAIRRRAA